MSACGLETARSIRSVIAAGSSFSFTWGEMITTSSWASVSSGRSSEPSSRMSHSMPVRIVNPGSCSIARRISAACAASRSGPSPLTTLIRGEWSVIAR